MYSAPFLIPLSRGPEGPGAGGGGRENKPRSLLWPQVISASFIRPLEQLLATQGVDLSWMAYYYIQGIFEFFLATNHSTDHTYVLGHVIHGLCTWSTRIYAPHVGRVTTCFFYYFPPPPLPPLGQGGVRLPVRGLLLRAAGQLPDRVGAQVVRVLFLLLLLHLRRRRRRRQRQLQLLLLQQAADWPGGRRHLAPPLLSHGLRLPVRNG